MIAAIFILPGFATLIYQVVWQRALFSIYGLDVQSVTILVTAFYCYPKHPATASSSFPCRRPNRLCDRP